MERPRMRKRLAVWLSICALAIVVLAVISAPDADGHLHPRVSTVSTAADR